MGGKLLYNVVLVSVLQEKSIIILYIYIKLYLYIPPPSQPPFLIIPPLYDDTDCQLGLPVLYNSFLLAIYFTHESSYMQYYFFNVSYPLLPHLYPQVHSLHLDLHFFSVNKFISTFFLDSICIFVKNIQYFSLFDLLHSETGLRFICLTYN